MDALKKEFDTHKSLRHNNIVDILGCHTTPWMGQERPQIQLVMQLCQSDLARFLESRGKFSSDETAHIVKQLLEGLAYLHNKNVIHRYSYYSNYDVLLASLFEQIYFPKSDEHL